MRPVFSAFIGTSLDGFIARADGSIDWLIEANKRVPEGEDCGYADFMASVDGILMGRKTFETLLGFESWPYSGTPVYVLSRTLIGSGRPLFGPLAQDIELTLVGTTSYPFGFVKSQYALQGAA
jgi:hypothetical protein